MCEFTLVGGEKVVGMESQRRSGLESFDFFTTQEKTRWRFPNDPFLKYSFVMSEERKEVGNIGETTFSIQLHPSSI